MVKKLPVLGMCIPTDDGSKEPKTEIFESNNQQETKK